VSNSVRFRWNAESTTEAAVKVRHVTDSACQRERAPPDVPVVLDILPAKPMSSRTILAQTATELSCKAEVLSALDRYEWSIRFPNEDARGKRHSERTSSHQTTYRPIWTTTHGSRWRTSTSPRYGRSVYHFKLPFQRNRGRPSGAGLGMAGRSTYQPQGDNIAADGP
jgi:hypothetical protein